MEGVELDAPGDRTRADFGAFFAEHHRELGLRAYRLSGDRQVAEEVTADAFAEAWRRWDEISRSESPAAEMRRILARYAQDRLRRADPNEPQDPYEPDTTHIQALLFERIALIPQPRTMTVLRGGRGGVEHSRRRVTIGPRRFRRPGAVRIVIAVNAAAAVIAIVVAMTTGGSSAAHSKSVPVSMADPSATAASPAHAGTATGAVASPSASAGASLSPTATFNQPTNSATSFSAATTAAAVLGAPSTSATASSTPTVTTTKFANFLTASGTVSVNSSTTWTELDVETDIAKALRSLTITFTVEPCPGLTADADWDDGASGQFSETTTTNANGSITYVFVLTPGDEVGPGDVTFAVQFSHDASGWDAGADTYDVAATKASTGSADDLGGSF